MRATRDAAGGTPEAPTPEATTSPPSPRTTGSVRRRTELLLRPLGWIYGRAALLRARRWKGKARRLSRPVLSVGNLTFGGTGKTPFVIHACRRLLARGLRPAILSRGYRAIGPDGNDEALLLRLRLPATLHLQDPDRFAAGKRIEHEVDCFVLDDGFQHLPLHRDQDVVLVDATDPFGGGSCPPAGRLREPLRALGRATLVILTRADLVPRESLGETMRAVRENTGAPVATAAFEPSCEETLRGRPLLLACGIGNPAAFRRTVEGMGARVEEERRFRDHHAFTAADAEGLARPGLPVVVTEKDAVKLRPLWGASMPPLLVVRIEFRALSNEAAIEAAFDAMRRG